MRRNDQETRNHNTLQWSNKANKLMVRNKGGLRLGARMEVGVGGSDLRVAISSTIIAPADFVNVVGKNTGKHTRNRARSLIDPQRFQKQTRALDHIRYIHAREGDFSVSICVHLCFSMCLNVW